MKGTSVDDHERQVRENALVDAVANDCASIRAEIAVAESRLVRRLADAWVLAAEQSSRIASADSRRRDMPLRCIAAQISVETHVHDRTVQTKMYDAWRLVSDFGATVTALAAGRISKAHADVILEMGGRLDDDVRAPFEAVVLEWAAAETVGRTRAYARQLAEKLDPRPMQERHAEAADERSITVVDLENGMSQIIALVPTVYAHAVADRLTQQGTAIKRVDLAARRDARAKARAAAAAAPPRVVPVADFGSVDSGIDADATDAGAAGADAAGADAADGIGTAEQSRASAAADESHSSEATDADDATSFDERTLDQVRADLFVDLLLTGAPAIDPTIDQCPGGLGTIRAQVQITMPLTTLTGVGQGGAEVDGKAPIDPETARLLAGATDVWNRVMYDPVTAVVVTVDRYQPTPAQRRFLEARDRHCRFPGCRMPARRCQVDHNHEHHEGGKTSLCNLACFCVRHHTMKTETDWTVWQLPGGNLEWTSPSGRSYLERPPRVVFVAEPAPF
jgi:hypothetical protein